MRGSGFALAGAAGGAAAVWLAMTAFSALDDGISRTYRCDQIALEAAARAGAEGLIGQLLLGKGLPDLEAAARAAGLAVTQTDKGDHVEVGVGEQGALRFDVAASGALALLPMPGTAPCESPVRTAAPP